MCVEMHGTTGGDVAQLRREGDRTAINALRRSVERGVKDKDLEKACRDSLHSLLWDRTKQRPMVIDDYRGVNVSWNERPAAIIQVSARQCKRMNISAGLPFRRRPLPNYSHRKHAVFEAFT